MLYNEKRNILTALVLLLISSTAYGGNPYLDLTNRFVSGVANTHGSLQDRLIEGAIEASTPEADESTRRIQRSAVKYLLTNDRQKSREHWRDVESGIKDMVERKRVIDRDQTRTFRKTASRDQKNCKIVNYGKPPGRIDVKQGCFNRQCPKISGVFSSNMGWGVSGMGEGLMLPIDMEVTVEGDRAIIHQSGFQTLNWFENVTVERKGDILIFGHDENTTFAMGVQENRRPVSGHRFFGAKGEYFSMMLPPNKDRKAILHFGILEPEDVLGRVCN